MTRFLFVVSSSVLQFGCSTDKIQIMPPKRKRSQTRSRLTLLGIAVIVVVLIFGGVIWMQDSPLREAEQKLSAGDGDAAMRLIREWESRNSPTGRSQALLARSLVELGDFRRATKIFETVGAANAKEIHSWAGAYLSLQQWSDALPLLKDLRGRDPENPDVIHELAACQAKLGQLEEALASAELFRQHQKYAHRAWLLIGVIHSQRGNKTAAIEAWREIEKHDPEFKDLQLPPEEFLTQFASLQIEQGQADEAIRLLDKALAIHETAEAQFQAGLAADLSGAQADAKRKWQRAIVLDPAHRNARESLARLAISAGDLQTAREALEPIAAQSSLRSSTAYLMQRVSQLEGDREQALTWQKRTDELRNREAIDSAVNRILREAPDSYWSQVIRSYQFAEKGNFQQAQQLLDQIPEANEDSFVRNLRTAVASRSLLPSKDTFPIKQF
jgi:tetratricopeptide (TPR) repeat protein